MHSACVREAPTRYAGELTGCVTLGIWFEFSKGPLVIERFRSIVTERATVSDRPRDL
jgi:hypothetical protein